MKIVLFCHPAFLGSQSMGRFANMLAREYRARGHEVDMWAPSDRLHRRFAGSKLAKWAGYVDQYVLFPLHVKRLLRQRSADTLYVFCDQALGPWVPLVKHLPHVVHVHDLLTLRSALGLIPENPTGFTGRIYQRYIRWGFRQARHFISISGKSRQDLHEFGGVRPAVSEVVYNGLNYPFEPLPAAESLAVLQAAGLPVEPRGMVLHVGSGSWYKNALGVVRLYGEYARRHPDPLPLLLVMRQPTPAVQAALAQLPRQARVLRAEGIGSRELHAAYSLARVFLFPSLAEGFGWPIIESQASGCPVITTDEAPMNEIGGPVARYLPRMQPDAIDAWVQRAADELDAVLAWPDQERARVVEQGLAWAAHFKADAAIDRYLTIYHQVFAAELPAGARAGEPTSIAR